jgi:adenylosuccinate synthase
MVTVVVGGQYGSEGKGKVAEYLAATTRAAAVVRVGGSNSGHTGYTATGERQILRHLPTAALLPDPPICLIGAGSYLDTAVLLDELRRTQLPPERLVIDHNAFLITDADREYERQAGLRARIGSTASGTGAAVRRRIERLAEYVSPRDSGELAPFVGNVAQRLRELLDQGARVIIEGTQGFGLSVLHSPHYPKATSRDTGAAAAASEAGVSPRDVDEVVLVIRSYPIRVAGDSGPLADEVDWPTVASEGGTDHELREYTSVTGLERRVGRFDPEIVRQAITVNNPSLIILNHVDYVDARAGETGEMTDKAWEFVDYVSRSIGAPIQCVGLGPTAIVSCARRYAIVS